MERSRVSWRKDMSVLASRSLKADLKSSSGPACPESPVSDLTLSSVSDLRDSDPDRRLSVTGWRPPYPES